MTGLTNSFIFDGLSLFLTEGASPQKKIAIHTASCEEIALFGECARVNRAIVAVHTVSKSSLSQIPHLNKQNSTFI